MTVILASDRRYAHRPDEIPSWCPGAESSLRKDLVARLEQRHLRPNRVNHAGRVEPQNLVFAGLRRGALAYLVVDGVGGNRLHRDADVASLRFGLCSFKIDQSVLVLDRQRLLVSDGFHIVLRSKRAEL